MGVVQGNKVKVGFFSFTEITDPAEHHSYNEWHQLDHMPEQFPLPGIAFGQRWVSTPACRAARAADGELLAPIHYVTLYLMLDPVDETLRDFMALGRELHEVDRFHQHRRALLSGPFAVDATLATPRVLISAEAVPYRPNRGVYVVVADGDEAGLDAEATLDVPGVAGVWTFRSRAELSERYGTGRRTIAVCWLDAPPLDVAPGLDALLDPGSPDLVFAGPFETVVPWQWDWFDQSRPG
ncbi:MAG TPA: hypothetical protein VFC99_13215 [Acidimicrobiia bacterium]|nr:hypothetical protein [Acidimicrobiia bacterium]